MIQKIILMNILITSLFQISCSTKQQEIDYGADNCSFCEMTIVDNRHSAELVTSKGKVYKFDAIECMIRYSKRNINTKYAHQLVANFLIPGQLVDAKKSTYLISKNIPSPMGEYLSGFDTSESANITHKKNGGTLYTWEQLLLHI